MKRTCPNSASDDAESGGEGEQVDPDGGSTAYWVHAQEVAGFARDTSHQHRGLTGLSKDREVDCERGSRDVGGQRLPYPGPH